MSHVILLVDLFLGSLLAVCLSMRLKRSGAPRPPGPQGLPFFGNALQIPKDRQWIQFAEWSKQYGDVVYINVMGTPTIILGSLQAAKELLDVRGNMYSDRPRAVMAGDLVGWSRGLGYTQGPPLQRFRDFRRLFHTFIGPRAASLGIVGRTQETLCLRLAERLMKGEGANGGEELADIVRWSTASLILSLTYGYDTEDQYATIEHDTAAGSKDPLGLVNIAEEAMRGFARASEPGAFWVDNFPWLRCIPSWFPGASFHGIAHKMRMDLERLYNVPLNFVKDAMKDGNYKPSFVSSYLEELDSNLTADEEELIKAAAASLYSGGAETTPSSIMSFILAMTLYPEVQVRAQAEIDAVLCVPQSPDVIDNGCRTRSPTVADRAKLPYTDAIVKEVWRWGVSVPLGLPHVCTQDDLYKGYRIEKGTVMWANIWSILHDEAMFPDPLIFRPERYLGEAEAKAAVDAVEVAFGFGRRICPGLYLAENSLFLAVATILSKLEIVKATDERGKEIHPDVVEYDGFISHPRPFKCKIRPRQQKWPE